MLYILNILLISVLGMLSSYTDIKHGMIQNRLVFPMLFAGILLSLPDFSTLPMFLVNALIAFIFGFALYLARLWSAGDSKLFLAFAVLFPIGLYPGSFIFFPAFSLVLNSFVPAFIALAVLSLLNTNAKQKIESLKSAMNPKILASLAIMVFAFYWLLLYLFMLIAMPLDFFLIVLILFLFVSAIEKAFPKKVTLVSAMIAIFFAVLNINELAQPNFWIGFLLIFILMVFMRFFILYLGFFAFGRRVEINDLKPGMVLLEGVFEKNGLLEKKKLFFPCLVNALQDINTNYVFDLSPRGLGSNDIAMLQETNKEGKVRFHSLLVQETLPFAPLLFMGALLTFFCTYFLPWC